MHFAQINMEWTWRMEKQHELSESHGRYVIQLANNPWCMRMQLASILPSISECIRSDSFFTYFSIFIHLQSQFNCTKSTSVDVATYLDTYCCTMGWLNECKMHGNKKSSKIKWFGFCTLCSVWRSSWTYFRTGIFPWMVKLRIFYRCRIVLLHTTADYFGHLEE